MLPAGIVTQRAENVTIRAYRVTRETANGKISERSLLDDEASLVVSIGLARIIQSPDKLFKTKNVRFINLTL